MNREILFRGKEIKNGEWVEGSYVQIAEDDIFKKSDVSDTVFRERHYIILELHIDIVKPGYDDSGQEKHLFYKYEVIPETVGQYTGLKDKNGKKIFEGDIIKWGNIIMVIEFIDNIASFRYVMQGGTHMGLELFMSESNEIEVLGNIHDNPELLKECK